MMKEENFKEYLKSKGINPNKTFGQNFLMNDIVLQDIVDAAEVTENDTVVEIGPGIGSLTELLCKRAGKVVCVEKDKQFEKILGVISKRNKNLKVYFGDVLSTNFWNDVRGEYKVVANIPYYITGKIIQLFVRAKNKPTTLTLLTQKEVAENIVALPGKLNLLGISVQLVGVGEIIQIVPPRDFFPAPKVMSAVVKIKLFEDSKISIEDENKFFKLLHAAFLGKRKQLHNSLSNNLVLPKDFVERALEKSGVVSTVRPQEISVDKWLEIFSNFKDNI